MFGIQQSAAPNSVSNILNLRSLDGRSFAGLLSQAAKIDPAPSMASGLRKEEDVKDNYIYAHPDENNSKQYLKICIHNRHRKLQEAVTLSTLRTRSNGGMSVLLLPLDLSRRLHRQCLIIRRKNQREKNHLQ